MPLLNSILGINKINKFLINKINFWRRIFIIIISGITAVPAGALGNFIGGYVMKRYRLRCHGIIRLAMVFDVSATVLSILVFVLKCDQIEIYGWPNAKTKDSWPNAKTNDTCSPRYQPICAQQLRRVYFSPCHAGCATEVASGEVVDGARGHSQIT